MFRKFARQCAGHNGGHPLARWHKEFHTKFGRHWHGGFDFPREHAWALDAIATDTEYVITAELPGFDVGELDVQLTGNVLTLTAALQAKDENQGKGRKVKRVVTLPDDIDSEKIEAKYVNGILEVRVAKSDTAKGRKVEIKT